MNIRTKHIFIERSACFEEPLQEVELVEEKTVETPSCSADHLDDENGSEGSDIADLMFHIREQNKSGSESDSDVSTHLPTWAKKTPSFIGTNIGNHVDLRRTRSDFQRAGIFISCHDSLLYETHYLMIGSDPNSYYHA